MTVGYEKLAYDSWLFPKLRGQGKPLTTRFQASVVVGHFFESYVRSLLGGVKDNTVGRFGVEPDLIAWNNGVLPYDLLVEVKGFSRTHGAILGHDQVERYERIQGNLFPFTLPEVYYVLCMHTAEKLVSTYSTEWDLAHGLGRSYIGMVILPIGAVRLLIDHAGKRPNSSWNSPSEKPDWLTWVSGPQLHKLIEGQVGIADWIVQRVAGWEAKRRTKAQAYVRQYEQVYMRTPPVVLHGHYGVRQGWLAGLVPK